MRIYKDKKGREIITTELEPARPRGKKLPEMITTENIKEVQARNRAATEEAKAKEEAAKIEAEKKGTQNGKA